MKCRSEYKYLLTERISALEVVTPIDRLYLLGAFIYIIILLELFFASA